MVLFCISVYAVVETFQLGSLVTLEVRRGKLHELDSLKYIGEKWHAHTIYSREVIEQPIETFSLRSHRGTQFFSP